MLPMSSEWLRVMLEEIARKKSAAAEARAESEKRGDADEVPSGEAAAPRAPPPDAPTGR
jgi:hypothetical protein